MQFLPMFMWTVKNRRKEINVFEKSPCTRCLTDIFSLNLPNNSLAKRFWPFYKWRDQGLRSFSNPMSECGPFADCPSHSMLLPIRYSSLHFCLKWNQGPLIQRSILPQKWISVCDFILFKQNSYFHFWHILTLLVPLLLLMGKKSRYSLRACNIAFIDEQMVLTSITFTTSENKICLILSFRHNLMTDQYWK